MNEVVQRVDAPGGGRDAVLFHRDCGATTETSTQLSIVASGEDIADAGNTFRASADRATARTVPRVEVRWLSADHLLVSYDERARVFESRSDVGGVEVTYVPKRSNCADHAEAASCPSGAD